MTKFHRCCNKYKIKLIHSSYKVVSLEKIYEYFFMKIK